MCGDLCSTDLKWVATHKLVFLCHARPAKDLMRVQIMIFRQSKQIFTTELSLYKTLECTQQNAYLRQDLTFSNNSIKPNLISNSGHNSLGFYTTHSCLTIPGFTDLWQPNLSCVVEYNCNHSPIPSTLIHLISSTSMYYSEELLLSCYLTMSKQSEIQSQSVPLSLSMPKVNKVYSGFRPILQPSFVDIYS